MHIEKRLYKEKTIVKDDYTKISYMEYIKKEIK